MVDPAAVQRIGQRAHDVLLADQFGETLGTPFAGEDEIGHTPGKCVSGLTPLRGFESRSLRQF
jgi:hypothetical protein